MFSATGVGLFATASWLTPKDSQTTISTAVLQQRKKQVTLSLLTLSEKPCTCDVPQQVTSQGEPMVRLLFTTQRRQQQLPEA